MRWQEANPVPEITAMALLAAAAWWTALTCGKRPWAETRIISMIIIVAAIVLLAIVLSAS